MNQTPTVYELKKFTDDPRFEGFGGVGGIAVPWTFPKVRTNRQWTVQRISASWTPPEVVGRVQPHNDYPCVDSKPAYSERAVDALRDFLEPNGELLPLKSSLGSYYAYNLTTVADVLDWQKSDVTWMPRHQPITAFRINRYEFFADRLKELIIFRIPENPTSTYVREAFHSRCEESGLQGFRFARVWPLPPGVSWFELDKQQWRARRG